MFWTILKTRIAYMFSSMSRRKGEKKQRSIGGKILMGLLVLLSVALIEFSLGALYGLMCDNFIQMGFGWLFFSIIGIMATVVGFIGSVFATQSQLYEAKDNELMLSMPVPPAYILLSRLLGLYFLDLLFVLVLMLPAGVVYCLFASPGVLQIIFFIAATLLLPLIALTFSCIVGWVVTLIGSRMKNKKMITTVLSVALFAAYMLLYNRVMNSVTELLQQGTVIAEAIKNSVFPAYHFGLAIADGNALSLFWFALC